MASLPAVVVLPEPCKPTNIIIVGFLVVSSGAASPPRSSTNSSLTNFIKTSSGLSDFSTSKPKAFSLTFLTNAFTTS